MSIRKRIASFIEIVSINEILEKTNIKRSTLYRVKNEEMYSIEVIEELFRVYLNLNPYYFFLGKGNMFLDSNKLDESNLSDSPTEGLPRDLTEGERHLYERLLKEKDVVIELLKQQIEKGQ